MSMTNQQSAPAALRLAIELEQDPTINRPSVIAELRRLHAENTALQQGYDAARLEIESLQARVQELGAMLRENRSKRIVGLEAQPAPSAAVALSDDSRTQAVYEVLINDNYPPAGSNEHWEGWKARLIVDALFPEAPAAQGDAEDAARWRDLAAAVVEASANGDGDTPFMKAFSDAIGDSEAPFTTEQFAAWVDAARKQGANHD